jgi:hypothetical protein
MAFSDLSVVGGNPQAQSGQIGSGRGVWVTAVANAKTALESPLQPQTAVSNSNLIKIGESGRRLLLRNRISEDGGTSGTAPVVYVYGLYGDVFAKSFDAYSVARVDNADADATGVTVPLAASPSATVYTSATIGGTAYLLGDIASLDGIDLKGAAYALVVVETEAELTDGDVAVEALVID